MISTLISYSKIKLPLTPYKNEYIIGIAVDEYKRRYIVQIDQEHLKCLTIGMKGNVKKYIGPAGDINVFTPMTCPDSNVAEPISSSMTIGVIGTGVMGLGIATVVLRSGYNLILKSKDENEKNKALKKISDRLLNSMTPENRNMMLNKMKLTTNLDDLYNANIIIECISEDADSKKHIFRELTKICLEMTIFATNTSSISIDDIASVLNSPDRFLGIHFFNPAPKMSLVEVIKGKQTSQKTLDFATTFVRSLKKIPIVVKDSPGFIVNRLLFSMINEACYMLEEGIATVAEIDNAMKLGASLPMGPFELADFIGLDITYNIINRLNLFLKDFKRPTKQLDNMVKNQMLGRKTGKGFYKY